MTSHVLVVNPAHAVRGPKYTVKKGKTPVLTAEEARELLDHIAVVKKGAVVNVDEEGVSEQPDLTAIAR